jgi:hypothetical protein
MPCPATVVFLTSEATAYVFQLHSKYVHKVDFSDFITQKEKKEKYK